jgi:hypothetical protein
MFSVFNDDISIAGHDERIISYINLYQTETILEKE